MDTGVDGPAFVDEWAALIALLRVAGDTPISDADRLDFRTTVESLITQLDAGVIREEFEAAKELLS